MNSSIAIPTPATGRKWVGWWIAPLALLIILGIGFVKFNPWSRGSGGGPITGQFYTIVPMDMDIKIVKDGELQAARYVDVDNRVEGVTQILWLEKEGVTVPKGAKLAELDSTNLQTRKEQLDLDVKKAEANLKIAQEMKDIQESQNATNKEAMEVTVELVKLDLKRYLEGTYPQQLADDKTALEMAQINLKNKEEDRDQTQALFAKGFVTAMDVKKAELEVTNQRNVLKQAETSLIVLEKYTRPMEMKRLETAVAQAEQRLIRVIRENASLLAQKRADLDEKQSSLALLKKQAAKLQDQIDNCTIRAPEAGLVIYMSSIDRSMREPIMEGVQVRQNQTLMRLPDVRQMKAVLKIQEALKPKLDVTRNQRAIVRILGVTKPVGATLTKVAVLPDNSQRWWNPDLKEYPIELTLDETPTGLKPGTRVDAEIFIDRLDQVLTVPLAALYTVGQDSYVFVHSGETVKERKVQIGTSNETHVQVLTGVSEGEEVLLLQAGQGRQLLEKAGIKVDEPTTRPARPPSRKSRRAAAL